MRNFNFSKRKIRALRRLYTHGFKSPALIPLKDEVGSRVLAARYFNGIDRPRVLCTLVNMADTAGARVAYFDFSTNLRSIPCYSGTLGLYVYEDLLDDSLAAFDEVAMWEDRVKSRFLRTRWDWPMRTRDEQWIFRFYGNMEYGSAGILEFTDFLTQRNIGLARFEGHCRQDGAGYGLHVSGTLRAWVDEIDEDAFRNVRRQLRNGAVPAIKDITFAVDQESPL